MSSALFDDLLQRWQDGEATLDELRELEKLLRSDKRHARALVRSIRVEVDLHGRYARESAPAVSRRRFWRIERVAAVLVAAVSLVALGIALLRGGAVGDYRVASGEVWFNGRALEVRGAERARVVLKGGSELRLTPGTTGVIRSKGEFELTRGGGLFDARASLRITIAGSAVSAESGEFSVSTRAQPGSFALTVEGGSVTVDYAGLRRTHHAGEEMIYGLLASPVTVSAADYERYRRASSFGLVAAIQRALAAGPGMPVTAVLEQDEDLGGRILFGIELAREGNLEEVKLDAASGEIIARQPEPGDWSKFAAAAKFPLAQAVQSALAAVEGFAVSAEGEMRDGVPQARVAILREASIFEVVVDLASGSVVRISRN